MFACSTKIQFCPLISQLKILSPTVGGWTVLFMHGLSFSTTLQIYH